MSVAAPARAPARQRRRPDAPAPVAVPRRARRVRPRRLTIGGAAWVVVLAALLGGIVALNVAALRDSIEVNRLQAQAQQLLSQNQLQRNRVTSLSSPIAIGAAASKLGMHPADPNTTRYVNMPDRHPAAGQTPMKRMSDHRLRLMLAMSLFAFVVVVGRAVQIQGVDAASLTRKAATQQRGETTLVGLRGSIVSADGQVLAQTQPSKTIVSDPKELRNVRATAVAIARSLGYRPNRRRGHKHHPHRPAQLHPNPAWKPEVVRLETSLRAGGYVVRQLQPEVAARIMRRHLPGISTVTELQRWYPDGAVASQLLGFTGIEGNAGKGAGAGLEHQYNHVLEGRPGKQVTVRDPSGTVLDTVDVTKPQNGRNVTLTLDASVQTKVQSVLAEAVRSSRAAWATGIVMNPRTGAVIAMATAPGYDNNQAHLERNMGLWSNQALQTVYEPGSTFKVVTFSAALTAGVVWPDEVLHNVPDFLNFGDKVIHDDTTHKPWNISVRRILKISSNIGTDEIAQMVGKQDLMDWIHRYGFGRETALRFPGESPGHRHCRAATGPSRRSAPSRSARASASPRCRWPRCTRRSQTAA